MSIITNLILTLVYFILVGFFLYGFMKDVSNKKFITASVYITLALMDLIFGGYYIIISLI